MVFVCELEATSSLSELVNDGSLTLLALLFEERSDLVRKALQ